MSEFLEEVSADCLEAETDLGARTMTWNGASYPVAGTLVHRGATLVIGGNEVDIKLTLRVRYSGTRSNGQAWEFTTLPNQGEKVTFNDSIYRIIQVNNAHSAFLEIDLMDANR